MLNVLICYAKYLLSNMSGIATVVPATEKLSATKQHYLLSGCRQL